MSEMLERVAKAIAGSAEHWYGNEDVFRAEARAAIEAMREPTEAMYAFANRLERKNKENLKHFEVSGFCGLIYQGMIDVAIDTNRYGDSPDPALEREKV